MVGKATRYQVQQTAAQEAGEGAPPIEAREDPGCFSMCEAGQLKPLGEEGKDRPRSRARCSLAEDQHEGRMLEQGPDFGHVLREAALINIF